MSSNKTLLRPDDWFVDIYRESFLRRAHFIREDMANAKRGCFRVALSEHPHQYVVLQWLSASLANQNLIASMLSEITGTRPDKMRLACDIQWYHEHKGLFRSFRKREVSLIYSTPLFRWMNDLIRYEGDIDNPPDEAFTVLRDVYFAVQL